MSFPSRRHGEVFLAQNIFIEKGFRWMARQEEIALFIIPLATGH